MRRLREVAVLVSRLTSKDSGLTENAGAGTALPVTGTGLTGESGSSLAIWSAVLTAPGDVGAKRTTTLRAARGASVNTLRSTMTLGWPLVIPVTCSGAVPGFDTIRFLVGVAPTKMVPKAMLPGLD